MECVEFRRQTEQWMEGERAPAAVAHAEDCPHCHALLAELEAIRAAAQILGAEEPAPPPRLWAALRAQLEAEGVIRERGWRGRLGDLFPVIPQQAVAGVTFAVLFALAAWIWVPSQSFSPQPITVLSPEAPTLTEMRQQVDLAGRRAASMIAARDPAVAASYRQNLAIVDRALELCEKAVRDEPDNMLAREYLYGTLRQKAELVATMMERSTLGE